MAVLPPSPDCRKKCKCLNGPNRGDIFDCDNPCGDLEYVDYDPSICECVPDGTRGYILYDQPDPYTYTLVRVSCWCGVQGDTQTCTGPGGVCCYSNPDDTTTTPNIKNLRVPFSGDAVFPITLVEECTRTQVPTQQSEDCGCPASTFSGTHRVNFVDGEGNILDYASYRDEGFAGVWCESGNPAPCTGTYPVVNVREFITVSP
jgi:hypothetical protein